MTSRALARRTLPFDAGVLRGLTIYARRAFIILSVASIVVAAAGVYYLYRTLTHGLPRWPQLFVILTLSYVPLVVHRWKVYRDLPTGLDQVIAFLLFVVFSPVYAFGAVYLTVRPSMFRTVRLVGLKGRVVTAVEYRPAARQEQFGAYKPDAFAFISLLPSMMVGSVRFRGRPLVRLDAFSDAGPMALRELGRSPGIFPAHTGGPATVDGLAIAKYVNLWREMTTRPVDQRDAILVIYLATVEFPVGAASERARIVLPFLVSSSGESGLREGVQELVGLDDLLLGRASHTDALIRAAWIAWGEEGRPGLDAPPLFQRHPKSPASGRRADA